MTESDALELAAKDAQEASLAMSRIKEPSGVIDLYARFLVHRIANTGDGIRRTKIVETMKRRVDGRALSTDIVSRTVAVLEQLDGKIEPEDLMAIMTWLAGNRGSPIGFTHTFLVPVSDGYTEASLGELNDWVERARSRIDAHDRYIFGKLAKQLNSAQRGIISTELRDAVIAMNDPIKDGETWRQRRIHARKMVQIFLRDRRQ